MKKGFYKADARIDVKDFYILPTIRIQIDGSYHYCLQHSVLIEFHFLVFHARLLFMENDEYKGYRNA